MPSYHSFIQRLLIYIRNISIHIYMFKSIYNEDRINDFKIVIIALFYIHSKHNKYKGNFYNLYRRIWLIYSAHNRIVFLNFI